MGASKQFEVKKLHLKIDEIYTFYCLFIVKSVKNLEIKHGNFLSLF